MAAEPPEHTSDHDSDPRPPADSDPTTDPDSASVTVGELAGQLRSIVGSGLDHATADTLRGLFALRAVRERARDTTDDGLAAGARAVIREALGALGDGTYGQAARLLFGANDDTRGQPARERRRLAAYRIDVLPDWFRRRYEPQITHDVAEQVLAIDHTPTATTDPEPAADGAAVVPVAAPRGPDDEDDDTTTAVALANLPRAPGAVTASRYQLTQTLRDLRNQKIRREWHLVWVVVGLVVYLRYGLDATGRYVLVLAVLGLSTIALDMTREWRATRSLTFSGDRGPRVVLLAFTAIAVAAWLGGRDRAGSDNTSGDDCDGQLVFTDPACEAATTTRATDPISPQHTPTTYTDLPAEPSPRECPPPGNTERRILFEQTPPLCIDPDTTYLAEIATNFGTFEIALNPDATWTVNNFVYLARWRFYDGVVVAPSEPVIFAFGVWVADPVAPALADQVPGYGLVLDGTSPEPFAITEVPVIAYHPGHPHLWQIVMTNDALDTMNATPDIYPRLGNIRCGIDVFTDPAMVDLTPTFTSSPVVIDTITITEHTGPDPPAIQPRADCDTLDTTQDNDR